LDFYVFLASTSWTVDGDIFLAGGFGRSYPSPVGVGGILVLGWMWICDNQDRQAVVNNFLSGLGEGSAAFMGVGGGFTTNAAGAAVNTAQSDFVWTACSALG